MRHNILSIVALFCVGCQVGIPLQSVQVTATTKRTAEVTHVDELDIFTLQKNQTLKKFELNKELKVSENRAELVMVVKPLVDMSVRYFTLGVGYYEKDESTLPTFIQDEVSLNQLLWSKEIYEREIIFTGIKKQFQTKEVISITLYSYLKMDNINPDWDMNIVLQKNKQFTFRFIIPDTTNVPYKRLSLLSLRP